MVEWSIPNRIGNRVGIMENVDVFYRNYLRNELDRRCKTNPRYSLRAFSRSLNVDVAALSRILSKKQTITVKTANKICENLSLEPSIKNEFINSVLEHRKGINSKPVVQENQTSLIAEDIFKTISEINHFSIMELTYLNDFIYDFKWMAKKLRISELEIKLAVGRLLSLGLLKEENGTLKKVSKTLDTADKTKTSVAHKKHQAEIYNMAINSLVDDVLNDRHMVGATLAIDPERMDLAKEMINNFMVQLSNVLGDGKKTQVYQIGFCLYPLSK